jgi:chondroitin 4-sulfotransferase 11
MIFHDLKAIFVHVERTGGVALRKYLLNYETNFKRIASTKHLSGVQTKELTKEYWDEYIKFGFVRNPYDRLVSWYCACREHQEWNSPVAKYFQSLNSFDEVIKDPPPEILESQYGRLIEMDFIGMYESYKEDVRIICDNLKIPYKDFVDNQSTHKNYREYYTDVVRKQVTEWYKEDLEVFEYEF